MSKLYAESRGPPLKEGISRRRASGGKYMIADADTLHFCKVKAICGKEIFYMSEFLKVSDTQNLLQDYEKVYGHENLLKAFKKSRKGKRGKASVAKFEASLLEALHLLNHMLVQKTYKMSPYLEFEVFEPKKRTVMSAAFKDKVVQHSLCDNVLEERF